MRFHFFNSAGARRSHEHFGAGGMPCHETIVEEEIRRFLASGRRRRMLDGSAYYEGRQAILSRCRTAIGQGGKVSEVQNLPCAHVVDNQYRRLVDQKTDYLLAKPLTFWCDDKQLSGMLDRVFDRRMLRTLKNLGRSVYNEGIGWLYVYYGADGSLLFRRFDGHQMIPVWRDEAHTELDYAIRVFDAERHDGKKLRRIRLAEIYDETGIYSFSLTDGLRLIPEKPFFRPYLTGRKISFGRVPLIAFRASESEAGLLPRVKSLQDGLNTILSNFQDAMEEDVRNTILVLVNYDGEDLGEFRRNLATYGAVKVKSVDGVSGDLKTLQVSVNHENYEAVISIFRRAIIENGRGFDGKDERLGHNANELNIRSIYADMDLDANETECEWQASLEELVSFLRLHCALAGIPVSDAPVQFVFNRDMLMNENEIIAACRNSLDLLSRETVIANHPWVDDVQRELAQLQKEKRKEEKS